MLKPFYLLGLSLLWIATSVSAASLNDNECALVNEASSTQTAFFSYNSNYAINHIAGREKISLKDHQMDKYALNGDAQGYYNLIRNNDIIINHIINSNCSKFYWSLLATGGMRDLEDKHGSVIADKFYADLKKIFLTNQKLCVGKICKEIILTKAKTIAGKDEGHYAWLTLKKTKNLDCHAVIDVGGQTGQIASNTHAFSTYLGKDRAIDKMGNLGISPCYNDQNQYNGDQCRNNIKIYLDQNFKDIATFKHDQYCKVYVISNFYNYFNDVCSTYLPHISNNNNLAANPSILGQITNLCEIKLKGNSFSLKVDQYKEITDEICAHWGKDWEGKKAIYAKDACVAGNYNYQVLKALGIADNHIIHVDKSDWALGAVIN